MRPCSGLPFFRFFFQGSTFGVRVQVVFFLKNSSDTSTPTSRTTNSPSLKISTRRTAAPKRRRCPPTTPDSTKPTMKVRRLPDSVPERFPATLLDYLLNILILSFHWFPTALVFIRLSSCHFIIDQNIVVAPYITSISDSLYRQCFW